MTVAWRVGQWVTVSVAGAQHFVLEAGNQADHPLLELILREELLVFRETRAGRCLNRIQLVNLSFRGQELFCSVVIVRRVSSLLPDNTPPPSKTHAHTARATETPPGSALSTLAGVSPCTCRSRCRPSRPPGASPLLPRAAHCPCEVQATYRAVHQQHCGAGRRRTFASDRLAVSAVSAAASASALACPTRRCAASICFRNSCSSLVIRRPPAPRRPCWLWRRPCSKRPAL